MVEFNFEAIWAWRFLCGKVLTNKFSYFYRYSAIHSVSSYVNFGKLCFQGICPFYLNCLTYWCSFSNTPLSFFYTYGIYSDLISLIKILVIYAFSFSWIVRLEVCKVCRLKEPALVSLFSIFYFIDFCSDILFPFSA